MTSYSYSFIDVAQQEYEEAINWYLDRSVIAAEGFISSMDAALALICGNPTRWRNEYKNYYELGLKKYPYSIVYSVEHEHTHIVIKSVFHHSRNPKKKYRR